MKIKLILILSLFFSVTFLASCSSQNITSDKEVTCEDIKKVYEEAGYEIFHKETTEQDCDWNCYLKCTAPDSDGYIFFYIFDTNEEAVNYANEREWNILLYFFSELFGDSLWLKTKSYNNITIEYDQNELYVPFESLINKNL